MVEWRGAICLHCLLREAQTALGRLLLEALSQESGRARPAAMGARTASFLQERERWYEGFQECDQRQNLVACDPVDQRVVDLVVLIADDVSNADDLLPGNFGLLVPEACTDSARRLAEDLKLSLDSQTAELALPAVGQQLIQGQLDLRNRNRGHR